MAAPTCTTGAAHTIGKTYATLTGVLVSTGAKPCLVRFLYRDYKTSCLYTTPWQSGRGDGSPFSAVITVATPLNSWDYFAQVANDDGHDYGRMLPLPFPSKPPLITARPSSSAKSPRQAPSTAGL